MIHQISAVLFGCGNLPNLLWTEHEAFDLSSQTIQKKPQASPPTKHFGQNLLFSASIVPLVLIHPFTNFNVFQL